MTQLLPVPQVLPPFPTADGLALHRCLWPAAQPRARLLLVHGLGEHSGRYARLAGELNAAGISVLAYDQRGHGRSPGPRGGVGQQRDALARDCCAVFSAFAAEGEDTPLLFGHSLGGLVTTYATVVLGLRPRGLVASSPALASHASAAQRLLARVMDRLWPGLTLRNGLPADKLSHDPAIVRAYLDDPLCHDRISARLAQFIFNGGDAARAAAPTLAVPMLLQIAGSDALVDAAGEHAFANAAPAALLQARTYPGLYHELYNEAGWARGPVIADLMAWLEPRLVRT